MNKVKKQFLDYFVAYLMKSAVHRFPENASEFVCSVFV